MNCNDWWHFDAGTSSELPTLNTNLSTQVGNESTLADLTTVPTGITANSDTENQNNLTLYSAAGVTAAIKLTYGIIFEGKIFNTAFSTWDAYTASVDNFWDHMDSQIEADSNYNSVTRVETDSAARADFTITAPLGQESTITPSFTQNGSSFSDAVQFSGYVAASGMASTADAYLYIRKYNANNAYKIAGTLGTTDYVRIDFQTNNTTTATNSSYTTNPVEINVADFATDANLWDKVLEAINNHGNISGSVTRANDTFTLVSTNTGDDNTYFVRESDTGNHISNISNTGGDDRKGVYDGQRFELPYYKTDTKSFTSKTFEIDTATEGSNNLTDANHIPLPALSSSDQGWQSTYLIRNNTEFWNAITASIAAADSGKVGDNYDITYTVDSSGAEPEAKIVFTVKENAIAPDGTITSGSWRITEPINTAGDPAPPDDDFSTYSAQCGSKDGILLDCIMEPQ